MPLRRVLSILGIAMVLSGLLWAAQGSGLFPYPATSPMIGSPPWIGWGLVLAVAGLLVLWLSRRGGSR